MRTATNFFVMTLLSTFGITGCKKADTDVTPVKVSEPSYFAGYTFEPKDLDDDQLRVLVSFCNPVEPADTEIGVYEFDPSTNADEDLAGLLVPRYDDDGNLEDRDEPDGFMQIQAKYTTPEGTKESDFNKERQFVVDIDRSNITILTWEAPNGVLLYVVINPSILARSAPAEQCLRSN